MTDPVALFEHRLALGIGCTRRELLDRLDEPEYQDWMSYYRTEPFGFPIENLRHGQMSVRTMQSSGLKLDQAALDPKAYMVTHAEPQSDEEMLRIGLTLFGAD